MTTEDDLAEKHSSAGALGPGYAAAKALAAEEASGRTDSSISQERIQESEVALTYPPRVRQRSEADSAPRVSHESATPSYLHFPDPPENYEPARPKTLADRIPARVPILTEKYRYDNREGFLR